MTVEIKKSALDKFRETMQRKFSKLEGIVREEITIINSRTRQGIDANGDIFAPYTPKYKKIREDKGFNTNPPDLARTGAMLSSMRIADTKITVNRAETNIRFGSEVEKQKAKGNMRKRKFFALSDEQKDRIKKRIQDA